MDLHVLVRHKLLESVSALGAKRQWSGGGEKELEVRPLARKQKANCRDCQDRHGDRHPDVIPMGQPAFQLSDPLFPLSLAEAV
jgi:hypothetical protein